MGARRDGDPVGDVAAAWREADLPELTPERVEALRKAGFTAAKLRHLAAKGRYQRALVVSVLACFTDAYPAGATVQDIARAGEASRMITSRSAAEFEAALAAHGLTSRTKSKPKPRGAQEAPRQAQPVVHLPPELGPRWWTAWSLVVLFALVTTTLIASLDVGFGLVLGVVWLGAGWALVIRRMAYRRVPVPRRVALHYLVAAVGFVLASVGAAAAVMVCFGQQGVGHVDSATQETGTHGTVYTQCSVDQPDGSWAELRFGGACPGPEGTPVRMYYVAGGDDSSPWRPVLGTAGSLAPMIALWGVGTLAGVGLMTRAALTS